MTTKVSLDAAYVPSDDVVAREIEGEIIIVPLVAGIGDMEDELYTLNETGRAVWTKLDSEKRLRDVVDELSEEFDDPDGAVEEHVLGFVEELLKRRMLTEVSIG